MVKRFTKFLTDTNTVVDLSLPITSFYRMFKGRDDAMADASGEPGRKAAELRMAQNVRLLLHRKNPDKHKDVWRDDVRYKATFQEFAGSRIFDKGGPFAVWAVSITGPAYVIKLIDSIRRYR